MRASVSTSLLYPFLLALPNIATGAPAGPENPPPELQRFVAKDESILAHVFADLNGDGWRDAVFIVEPTKRGEVDEEEEGPRTLKIAIRAPNGALQVVKQSKKVVYCRSCGGMLGDPFDSLEASGKSFSIRHHGGSSWRWLNTYTFAYSKRDNTWQLVRVDESSFHASDPEKMESKTHRPPRSFGKIDIADFEPEKFLGVGRK